MIGIFGGTFDPVHYGHIRPALAVMHDLGLSQLRFIPNRVPPHREQPWLDTDQRLALLRIALDGLPDITIDDRELIRDGASYMVDTLTSLVADFPDETLVLIVGMDVALSIDRWYRWRQLFERCHLVVTARPGFREQDIAGSMSEEDSRFLMSRITTDQGQLNSQAAGKILLKSVPQLDISATQIRHRLMAGEDVSEWMPEQAYKQLRGYVDGDR